ncbi:dihydrodipicolinate synthase, partial [uncultured Rothia sp.]|uniref:dihydrodipicolinate synthase n=1 Tax=uncultured Rothia sp. TaxID=316088 RepID=UPI0025E7E996
PHRLASSTSLPEGTHAITLLPGAWGDPATGAYGGLPELPGVLVRWVLCIAAMVAVVHLCGVKAKGQSFTIPHDARSRLIALMQALGIFGAFALVVWIEYMMTPLTLMFETVYAGPTAAYSGDGMIPLHLFLSSSLSAIFLGYFCVNILASLNIPGYLGIPAIIYVGALPWAQAERHQFTLALAWVIAVTLVSWLVRGMWGTLLACVGYSLWIVLVATSGDPFDLSANMSRVLVILGFPLAFIVVGGGIYRIFYLRQNPKMLRYLQERALYLGEW